MIHPEGDVQEEDRPGIRLQKSEIYIIGTQMFQNSLMARILSQELSMPCYSIEEPGSCPPIKDRWRLILLDSFGSDSAEDIISSCRRFFDPPDPGCLLAIFNAGREMKSISRKTLPGGIRGIFFAEEAFDLFLKGIRCILNGEYWFSRELLNAWIKETGHFADREQQNTDALTPREEEILKMVATGASNNRISENMYISYHTVKTHLNHIYRKINVSNRLQASLWAEKNL